MYPEFEYCAIAFVYATPPVTVTRALSSRGGTVKYIKGVFVGLLAVVVIAVVSTIAMSIAVNRNSPAGYSVGIDPSGVIRFPAFWIVVLLVFAVGFFWQLRRT